MVVIAKGFMVMAMADIEISISHLYTSHSLVSVDRKPVINITNYTGMTIL